MAKVQKFNTLEEVVAATGIEVTDQNRAYLESFVKKAVSETAGAKKAELMAAAEAFGLTGLDAEKENTTTLQIKILTHLYEEGRHEEMNDFAAAHKLHVTEDGHIHRLRQAVKPIEQRNAGMREGTVGYNTIQLLKNPEFADLSAGDLALKLKEIYNQPTTAPSVQWYINFCHKKLELAKQAVNDATEAGDEKALEVAENNVAFFTIAPRKRTAKAKEAGEGGVALGAELTLEKATAPKGFAKKKAEAAPAAALGEELQLNEGEEEAAAE